jgi:hypothetical protein
LLKIFDDSNFGFLSPAEALAPLFFFRIVSLPLPYIDRSCRYGSSEELTIPQSLAISVTSFMLSSSSNRALKTFGLIKSADIPSLSGHFHGCGGADFIN